MSWLAVIAAALGLIQSLIQYLRDQKTIDAATADALLKSNRESLDAINKAKAARELVRADLLAILLTQCQTTGSSGND